MAKDLLLEIGAEEIPARFMEPALAQLAERSEQLFASSRLEHTGLQTFGTPRRLALLVNGLKENQADVAEEIKGPPARIAFDAQGNPTQAAQGFARSQGVELSDLQVKELPGGRYVVALKKTEGKAAGEVLQNLLPELIQELKFPKSMRWGDEELRFVRPIRWLVALFGSEVVEFELAGVKSGRMSYGHRFLSDGELALEQASAYLSALESGGVLADQNRRREMIWQQVAVLAGKLQGEVRPDPELLTEVTHLVEYPTALSGSFNQEYLELPAEVLITPMREHQRYFPVWGNDGRLLPVFITVRNGGADETGIVRRGNEKVLTARLADARFFWEEDLKTPLVERVQSLENVVFQEELGSMLAKVRRLEGLAQEINQWLNGKPETVRRVALLAKADLLSSMVYEFPELQGVMGSYYAAAQGESEEVCRGIREHYLPRFTGDETPQSAAGIAVSLADKLDSLVGYFGLGLKPTGSQDPFALRRQALGVLAVLLESGLNLSLEKLTRQAYSAYGKEVSLKLSPDDTVEELLPFFLQRLENMLSERGYRYDTIGAVLARGGDNPVQLLARAAALKDFRQMPEFNELLAAHTRVASLAEKAESRRVSADLWQDPAEERLWQEFQLVNNACQPLLAKGKYLEALKIMAGLRPVADNFFNAVMVMADDEKVRQNRLALLGLIADLFNSVAELSKIVA